MNVGGWGDGRVKGSMNIGGQNTYIIKKDEAGPGNGHLCGCTAG